jgi:hypothetical protein
MSKELWIRTGQGTTSERNGLTWTRASTSGFHNGIGQNRPVLLNNASEEQITSLPEAWKGGQDLKNAHLCD